MGGEYFHFEKGVKKQKKGGLIAYKWRPDDVKNLNVHLSILELSYKNVCKYTY